MMDVLIKTDSILFQNLPRPISVNTYVNSRYPKPEKIRYLKDFDAWKIENGMDKTAVVDVVLDQVFGNRIKSMRDRSFLSFLRLEYRWTYDFITPGDRKAPKRVRIIDSSNFIKAAEDQISKMIMIDDCYFKNFSFHCKHSETEKNFSVEIFNPRGNDET